MKRLDGGLACRTQDWRTFIVERAAVLEYDNGLSRRDAEAKAIAEYLNKRHAGDLRFNGVLGELIRAARNALHPDLRPVLESLGLLNARTPMWGFAYIVPDGDGYRPASPDEFGRAAVIVPSFDHCGLADLVAEDLQSRRLLRRLGVASLLGVDQVELARETEQPLLIFDSALSWLGGHTLGAAIVDWATAGHELDGVKTLICNAALALRLHAITRKCWRVPTIVTPSATKAVCHGR